MWILFRKVSSEAVSHRALDILGSRLVVKSGHMAEPSRMMLFEEGALIWEAMMDSTFGQTLVL